MDDVNKENETVENTENIENADKTANEMKDKKENMEDQKKENDDTSSNKIDEGDDKREIENDEKEESSNEKKETSQDEKIKEANEKYTRLLAEFDNFRKRNEKEKTLMIDLGAISVIDKFLPLVDNFERAMENVPEEIKENAFVVGIENIYKQIDKILSDLGVKPIESVGKKFDEKYHNAVLMDEESDVEEGIITQEMQKGYMYKEEVIRHSMVKVKK